MDAIIFLLIWFITIIMIPLIRGIWWFFFADYTARFIPGDLDVPLFILVLILWPLFLIYSMLVSIIQICGLIGELIIELRNKRFEK